jgi:hypothetical protein
VVNAIFVLLFESIGGEQRTKLLETALWFVPSAFIRNICQSALLEILLEIKRISPFALIGVMSTTLSFLQEDKMITAATRYFFIKAISKMTN